VIATFTRGARAANAAEVGRVHHVMIEGVSKKSDAEWKGLTDHGKRVMLPRAPVAALAGAVSAGRAADYAADDGPAAAELAPGDYVAVRVTEAISANTLRAEPLARCSIAEFARAFRADGGQRLWVSQSHAATSPLASSSAVAAS